jgi:hypothetical protein
MEKVLHRNLATVVSWEYDPVRAAVVGRRMRIAVCVSCCCWCFGAGGGGWVLSRKKEEAAKQLKKKKVLVGEVRSSRWRFFKVIEGEHVFQTQFIAKEEN